MAKLSSVDIEFLRNIFDAINIGIHIIDKYGVTIYYNKICEDIEGMEGRWIIGMDMKELVISGIYSESIALECIKKKQAVKRTQKANDKYIYSVAEPVFIKGEFELVVVSVTDMVKIEELKEQYKQLQNIHLRIQDELSILRASENEKGLIISKSKKMENIKSLASRVAKVDSTVLIDGESGVGKGVLSKFIHQESYRKEQPFVKVDCSALPESLIESELFGYEAGAFTGARKEGKIGLLELSNKGTLFLDEIGEIPLNIQVKLLNVFQDKNIQRVGGTEAISIDTRIIAATNKDLAKMVEDGKFRSDLYYRLKVVPITIPPLRERRDDIVPLANFFLEKANIEYNFKKVFSSNALKALIRYPWLGNIRELENVVERLVVTSENDFLEIIDLEEIGLAKCNDCNVDESITFKEDMIRYERLLLEKYLSSSSNIRELSLLTGLEQSTIRKKAKRIGVELKYGK